jgi:hypothetical protein
LTRFAPPDRPTSSFDIEETKMAALYDHIQQLRAELSTHDDPRHIQQIERELEAAQHEQAKLDADFIAWLAAES